MFLFFCAEKMECASAHRWDEASVASILWVAHWPPLGGLRPDEMPVPPARPPGNAPETELPADGLRHRRPAKGGEAATDGGSGGAEEAEGEVALSVAAALVV